MRHQLVPGRHVEFVDDEDVIRLPVRRRVVTPDPAAGYRLIKVKPTATLPNWTSLVDLARRRSTA